MVDSNEPQHFDRISLFASTRRLSRRQLLRCGVALGLSAPLFGAPLIACRGTGETGPTTVVPGQTPAPTSKPSPIATQTVAKRGGSIKVGITVDALTFDPHNYKATTDLQIDNLLYDTLVGIDPSTFELIPRLALRWDRTSETTWRLELRRNVKFTDGTPFNAEAVKFNIDRARNASRSQSYVASIKSVDIVDDFTIDIHTDGPYAPLMRNLSVPIVSIVSPTAAQASEDALVEKPIGTGPFLLKEWIPRERIVIVRNPDYWGEPALLDEITFFPIPDDSTRLTSYQAGDIDVIINPPLEAAEVLKQDPNTQMSLQPATRTVWLGFNVGDQTLQNEKLRQAIAKGVDRHLLVATITMDLMRQAVGLVPPEILKPSFELPHPFDMNSAKQLLADAGYSSGLKLNFWTPQGRYPKDRQIAEAIQQQLNAIGIETELSVIEWGPYLDSLTRHEQQMYLIGWGFSSGDPDGGLRQIAWSKSSFNYTNLQDPEVDAALETASREFNPERRAQMYNDLQLKLLESASFIPIYHTNTLVGSRKRIKNFIVNQLEMFDLKQTYLT